MTLPRSRPCAQEHPTCPEKQVERRKCDPDVDLPGSIEIDVTVPTDPNATVIASSTKKRPKVGDTQDACGPLKGTRLR
jgi:hypothetical protein